MLYTFHLLADSFGFIGEVLYLRIPGKHRTRGYRVVLLLGGGGIYNLPRPKFLFRIAFDLIRQNPHLRTVDLRWSDIFYLRYTGRLI